MITSTVAQKLREAVSALQRGEFILLHDDDARENEIDMVLPAHLCTPSSIAFMRQNAGGLICAAIGRDVAAVLQLPYMHDLLLETAEHHPVLRFIIQQNTPYGGRPAFSITLNHREVYTGITDMERSMTIRAIGDVASALNGGNPMALFTSTLISPGHVPLLLEADGGLKSRRGHTELSIALMRMAGLPSASVLCEMLDAGTHRALSISKAMEFAKQQSIPLVDGRDIVNAAGI